MASSALRTRPAPRGLASSLGPAGWALLGIVGGAAALRFSTLGVQSFWHDEAVTVGRVLHPGLGATLREIPSSEATPPLYYMLAWLWSKLFGTSEAGIRSLSALFGTATVPVAYAIGARLVSRRAGLLAAAAVAASPLMVWYSQEARAYALLVLTSALTVWLFACVLQEPERRRWLWWWAAASALALLSHYFAVFVVVPEAAWLLWSARGRVLRPLLLAIAIPAVVALALLPLAIHQAGRGHDRWIAAIPFGTRATTAVKQYVQGVGGTPSAALSIVIAVCALAGAVLVVTRTTREERRGLALPFGIAAAAVLLAVVLAGLGKDYVVARNLIVAWVPLAVVAAAGWGASRAGVAGLVAAAGFCAASIAIVIGVDREPRLQRPDWRGAANVIGPAAAQRALVVPFIGDDPLAYYLPNARVVRHGSVRAGEVDVVGWALRHARVPRPPAAGFRLVSVRRSGKLTFVRFVSSRPATLTREQLAKSRIGEEHGAVLEQQASAR
ncbi:MAG: glycosyltransferase family 39 protein [Thermoleophilaceae bacterium]